MHFPSRRARRVALLAGCATLGIAGAQVIDGAGGADTAQVDATDQVANVETIDGADKTKPKVAFLSKNLRVKGGKAILRIKCPAGESACNGKARILVRKKVVGAAAFKVAGGKTVKLKIALKRNTRIALSKDQDKKLAATVKITAKDAAGNTGTTSRKLNLKG